jgi:hypothetical protein
MRIYRFPEDIRRKIYVFTFSQKEEHALRQIWRHLETAYPKIDATGSATLPDLNDGWESEAEIEVPCTPDVDEEDFNNQPYLEDDEMDETETAAADLLDAVPEPTDSGDELEDDDPSPHGYEADAIHSTSDTVVSSDRLLELVFQLAVALFTSPFRSGNPHDGAVGHFLAAHGINVSKACFRTVHDYPPYLSGLGWIAQLLFLEYALPISEYPDLAPHCLPRQQYRDPLKRIRCVRSTYMVVGKNYPLSELWSLRNFGRKIGRKEPPRAQLAWSLNGDELEIDGGRITMSDFRSWIQSHIRRTYDNLQSLLRGFSPPSMDLNQTFSLVDVRDRHVNNDHLYCFRTEKRNGLKDKWIDLSRHIRQAAAADADSLHQNGGLQVDLEGVHDYLDQHLNFLKWDLLPTCHTTGGSPARGPEVNSVKAENPKDFFRNVFVYNGHLCFLTEYHKARSSTNYAFYVARFFPSIVGRMLYTYIVYVRPYVEHLAARVHRQNQNDEVVPSQSAEGTQNQKPQNTYLFTDPLKNEAFWDTSILTNALKRSSRSLDVLFTVRIYRHVAIGIIRKYIALLIDPFQTKFKGQFDLFAQAHIFQTAHGLEVDSHYAMDREYQTKCQPSILNAYFKASSFWWRWLNVDESDFMLAQDPSQDDQAPSIVPASILGSIPPSSAPTFTFDGEDNTIMIDPTLLSDDEPVRSTRVEVIIPRKSQEEHTSSSEDEEVQITIPRKPAAAKRKTSLSSLSREEHTPSSEDDEPIRAHRNKRIRVELPSSEDDEPIRAHRYKRIRVERPSSITPFSSPATEMRVSATEGPHSPGELTFNATDPTLSPTHQPDPTETEPSDPEAPGSEPEPFPASCARPARERARPQPTSPHPTTGPDTCQSAEGPTRPTRPSPPRCPAAMHAITSPAATRPVGPAASPRQLKAMNVFAPVVPNSPLQATSPLNPQAPLEPMQLFTRHQPSIPSTLDNDHADLGRRLRAAGLTGGDPLASLIAEEMDAWNR